jgi:hypothetical protein
MRDGRAVLADLISIVAAALRLALDQEKSVLAALHVCTVSDPVARCFPGSRRRRSSLTQINGSRAKSSYPMLRQQAGPGTGCAPGIPVRTLPLLDVNPSRLFDAEFRLSIRRRTGAAAGRPATPTETRMAKTRGPLMSLAELGLIADVGATNARFALVAADGTTIRRTLAHRVRFEVPPKR